MKGWSFVRAVIHRCTTCRKHEEAGPPPSPQPEFRMKEDPAFTCTGVDFVAPLFVWNGPSSHSSKVWIRLSMFLVTRAIHLDIVSDLSATSFIWCLKQLPAGRGLPPKFLTTASRLLQNSFQGRVCTRASCESWKPVDI